MAEEKTITAKAPKYIEVKGIIVAGAHREGHTKDGNAYAVYSLQLSVGLPRVLDVTLNGPRNTDLDIAIQAEESVLVQAAELRARDYSVAVVGRSITLSNGKVIVAVE